MGEPVWEARGILGGATRPNGERDVHISPGHVQGSTERIGMKRVVLGSSSDMPPDSSLTILHVNKFLYRRGGAEAYMLDVAELQRQDGHEPTFFAMEHPDNLPSPNDSEFPSRVELDPPPRDPLGRLRVAGRIMYSKTARSGIEAIIEKTQPDVVHLHNIYHQLSPSILRPIAEQSIPAVMTLHDYKLACPTYQFLDDGEICEACIGGKFQNSVKRRCNRGSLLGSALLAIETAAHRYAKAYDPVDVFICPSKFMEDKMREAGVFPDRLAHLNHFVDVAGTQPAGAPGDGALYAGRLSAEKGVDTLIDAIGLLDGGQLVVAGDGPERSVLEEQAARVAPGRVRFLGRLDAASLQQEIRSSAVLVLPARWYENQPMIILESFTSGRPVIASDLGGLPELIRPGENGDLIPPNDAPALAESLARMLGDPEGAHKMGLAARLDAERRFSASSHLSGLEALYERAIQNKERSPR